MPLTKDNDVPISYHTQPLVDEVTSVGVDYFTITSDDPKHAHKLWVKSNQLIDSVIEDGNDERPFRFKGYAGRSAAGVTVASLESSVLCRASGSYAREHWPALLPHAKNVSRLDLQVTGRYHSPIPDLAVRSYERTPARPYDRGRPRALTLITHKSYGDSFLLGSRSSDAFARHYDKGAESGSAPTGELWRWELELKRSQARLTSISLVGMEDPSTFIQTTVYNWLWRWGLRPGFPRR